MTPRPHGPVLPGQLGALLVLSLVLGVSGCGVWAIWEWPPHPLVSIFAGMWS